MQSSKAKILVVDDDEDLAFLLSSLLQSENYETHCAYDGIRAMQMIHKINPDLILLDINIPAGNGQTVLSNLKKHFSTWHIPVIVLTGNDDPEIKRNVFEQGVKGFFLKPYQSQEILEKVKELLEEREQAKHNHSSVNL